MTLEKAVLSANERLVRAWQQGDAKELLRMLFRGKVRADGGSQWRVGIHVFASERKFRLFALGNHYLWVKHHAREKLPGWTDSQVAIDWLESEPFHPEEIPVSTDWPLLQDPAFRAAERSVESCKNPLTVALLHCLFGNPFLTTQSPEEWNFIRQEATPEAFERYRSNHLLFDPNWRTPVVLSLCRQVYQEQDFADLPVLADALQDAGCQEERILQHLQGREICSACKGQGCDLEQEREGVYLPVCERCSGKGLSPFCHGVGCWVIDLLLGKC